uniref:Secreted protein n=1 Tax=Arundo donax TaxID=35708 RepID=A0A0A9D8V8_ARUDO
MLLMSWLFLLHVLLLMRSCRLFSSLEPEHCFQNLPRVLKFCKLLRRATCQLPTMRSLLNASGAGALISLWKRRKRGSRIF